MSFILTLLVAFFASFVIIVVMMPFYIRLLISMNMNQEVSEYALDEYKNKAKTPIMGGLLFVIIPIIIFFCISSFSLQEGKVWIVLLSYFLFCLVGFWDDMTIIIRKNNLGLTPRFKLILEFIFVCLIYILFRKEISSVITIPLFHIPVDISWLYIPFMVLLYLAEANAVNFTDGMDGLCAGVSLIGLIFFGILAFLGKEYSITIFIACVCGGLCAYLIYNSHPAKIFMGDSGSLALGALFSALAVVMHKEIALFFIGGVFVWEMFCVCLQLTWVKLFHKRVFSYTPIHYSFTLKGMKETKVVWLFYAIAVVCGAAGFVLAVV